MYKYIHVNVVIELKIIKLPILPDIKKYFYSAKKAGKPAHTPDCLHQKSINNYEL